MDRMIFGKNKAATDFFIDYKDKKSWERDRKAFSALEKKLSEKNSLNSNIFIVFLDSTHSEYGWPDDFKIKFLPISSNINYIKLPFSRSDVPNLKNRYSNAINYLDSLFESFFRRLKELNLYDDAIIVVTADHGEEFFEEQALFHGTHLNKYQTNIPIFYKIPGKTQKDIQEINQITSQVDIFPSLFHYLTDSNVYLSKLFDGKSIFTPDEKSFCICSAQNGSNSPVKFVLYEKDTKTTIIRKKNNLTEILKEPLKENILESD